MAPINLELAQQCADTMSAFAEPIRVRIIDFLRTGPKNVAAIRKALKAGSMNLSHHVKVLRKAGVVENKKVGRTVVYSLAPEFTEAEGGLSLDLGWCTLTVAG